MMSRWKYFSFDDVSKPLLGAVAIVALLVLVTGAFAIGSLGLLESRYEMSAVFENASGLKAGSPVRRAGIEVGEVAAVHPDYDAGQIVVEFEVDHGIDLGPNTSVSIATDTLFGGAHLRLSGNIAEPFMVDLPVEARRIPLERTDEPFTIVDALDTASKAIDEIDTDLVNRLTKELAEVAANNQDDIGPLLENIEILATAIASRSEQLRSLLNDSQKVVATLASRDQELVRIIDASTSLVDAITRRRTELATILGEGSQAVADLTELLEEHKESLKALTEDVHLVIAATGRHLPEIDFGFAWLGPTFSGLASVGNAGPWFDFVMFEIAPSPPKGTNP